MCKWVFVCAYVCVCNSVTNVTNVTAITGAKFSCLCFQNTITSTSCTMLTSRNKVAKQML